MGGLQINMNNSIFRKEILDKDLSRPIWTKQDHRLLSKLWLDKNECTDIKMNAIVLQSLSKISPESIFSYPNLDVLYSKIAKLSNLSKNNILLTAGSDGAIRACFESCIEPGDNVILSRPTFAMYEVYSKVYGANITWLDYEESINGPVLELDKVLSVIRKIKPKIVCLPNPDSPTGTIFLPDDMKKIINISEKVGALMLVDEAYYPLYQWTAAPLINEYNNLVVVRSFSKSWGAAGLRVGYALANNKLIMLLHKQRPMYEIGSVSAQAIEILLDHEEDMLRSVKRVNTGKEYFQEEMKKLGFSTYASYGNFFHIKFGTYAEQIHSALEDKVYYRKDFNVPCLRGYSRFSATTRERFKPIVSCIADVINKNKSGLLE
jgi:histidinol-phosphate aminotransferase